VIAGLDIPTLDTVVLATPKSDIKQSVGRILRETAGKKNEPLILDIVDAWGFLYAMFGKRRRVYREGGFLMQGAAPQERQKQAAVASLLTKFSFKL
jgi:superfamily II DNA or RNA helicase